MGEHANPVQLQLPLVGTHGGRREGSGRKRKRDRERTRVAHRSRDEFKPRFPALVTLKLRPGLPSLRTQRLGQATLTAVERGARYLGFRVCEYSIQIDHLHLIVEADSADALARGLVGLQVRVARAINRTLRRRGPVFLEGDRYHARPLKTPREVWNALGYVLHNCHNHADPLEGPDPLSSGWQFRGWDRELPRTHERTLPEARTWLLTVGWRKFHGPVSLLDVPFYRRRRVARST